MSTKLLQGRRAHFNLALQRFQTTPAQIDLCSSCWQ